MRESSGGQAQRGEDAPDHRRINDGGDDLQIASAVWAVLHI
jgi:hypothetical protein